MRQDDVDQGVRRGDSGGGGSYSTRCRDCRLPCFWAVTVRGKNILMESAPAKDGGFRLEFRTDEKPLAVRLSPHDEWLQHRYHTHFSRCAQARPRDPNDGWRDR